MSDDSDLAVPFELLSTFAGEVESVRTRLNGFKGTFEEYRDDLGDSSVQSAVDSFVSNWKDGRNEISNQLEGLKEITEMVVEEFGELIQELIDAAPDFSASEEGGGGGGGGGDQQAV